MDVKKATLASTGVWLATRKARLDHEMLLSPSHVSHVIQFIFCLFVFWAAAFAATATAVAIIVFHETILHSAVRNSWDDHACCVAHLPYNSYYCYYHSHNERSCHLPNPR